VGERTRKPLSFEITELLFADNGVIVDMTWKRLLEYLMRLLQSLD